MANNKMNAQTKLLLFGILWSFSLNGRENSVVMPSFDLLGYDLRRFVVSESDLNRSIQENLVQIDFTYVSPYRLADNPDLGYNKTHFVPAPINVLELIDLMKRKFTKDRILDLGFVIYVVQKKSIWKFYYKELPDEYEELAKAPLKPGDLVIVKRQDD